MSSFTVPLDLEARLEPAQAPVAPPEAPLRHAAVLAALIPRYEDDPHRDPGLVLIQRSYALKSHAGQLAFPGGKPEPGDDSLLTTALREASEEVALPPGAARVVGRLDPVATPSGFFILPFVAWVSASWRPEPDEAEVHRVLVMPLGRLAEPSVHQVHRVRSPDGRHHTVHAFDIGDPPLWGATAHMVWDLLQRMRA